MTIDDLWLDWATDGEVSWNATPDAVDDSADTTGTVVLSWDTAADREFTLSITPPSRYGSGTYMLSLSASDGGNSATTTVTFTID